MDEPFWYHIKRQMHFINLAVFLLGHIGSTEEERTAGKVEKGKLSTNIYLSLGKHFRDKKFH